MSNWPRAIVFDFDGVLVSSEPLHYAGFRQTLATVGIELTEADYYAELIGFDDRNGFAYMLDKHGKAVSSSEFESLLHAKENAVRDMIASGQFDAMPGVKQLVPALAERYPLAICSGALRHEIEFMLDAIGLRSRFPIVVAAEDVTIGKPDPSGYLRTIELLSQRLSHPLEPADCLVVEDAPTVIRSVKQVGFKTLGVAGSYPIEALVDADYRVESLEPSVVCAQVAPLASINTQATEPGRAGPFRGGTPRL